MRNGSPSINGTERFGTTMACSCLDRNFICRDKGAMFTKWQMANGPSSVFMVMFTSLGFSRGKRCKLSFKARAE